MMLGALFASPVTFDTSSQLLLKDSDAPIVQFVASRFLVWDMVYYASLAYRGVQAENDYAFSRYWAGIIRVLSPHNTLEAVAITAGVISIVSHAVAVLLLFNLLIRWTRNARLSFYSACLYILSPAGAFLITGYPESLVALLSFAGLLALTSINRPLKHVLAGALFGGATLLRSNGLLWGIVFAAALLRETLRGNRRPAYLANIILGGSIVGAAFVLPQVAVYYERCPGLEWCSYRVPSIYAYVQSHYWDNGFLKYWTLMQTPNFAFGMPTIVLLLLSCRLLWRRGFYGLMAVQLVLAFGALFFWHVQIITRIGSCTPGPYWYVADLLSSTNPSTKRWGKLWAAYFAIWGLTQAVLFGAFLPPA